MTSASFVCHKTYGFSIRKPMIMCSAVRLRHRVMAVLTVSYIFSDELLAPKILPR